MEKMIMGRWVDWDVKEKEIYIHLNAEDRSRMEKQKEELGYIDYVDNDLISAEYFNDADFLEIHDVVFPSGRSWQQESWNDVERGNFLEIRIQHPDDEEDE